MPIHFSPEEMQARKDRAAAAITAAGLDGLLMFKQESMYWLTGYDTFGFSMFQCLVMTADGRIALLTRAPDYGTAFYTSDITDVRIWVDVEGMNPAMDLRAMLDDLGLAGSRVGIELDSYGLRASMWRLLEAELDGFLAWEDASTLVQEVRRAKSPQELEYVRRAAELADDAWDEAVRLAGPGVDEAEILAAMQGAVFLGGGDYAGNELIIGSGPGALMVRYTSGRRRLDADARSLSALPTPCRSTCTGPARRRCWHARTPSGPAPPSARCSTCTPGCSTAPASASTGSTPAATGWAPCTPRCGPTGRCSTRATRWCSSRTTPSSCT